ncbi:glycosyltransferase family 1 protein [Burkholderia sp. L27(2015)]|uniref:glycosyltransferase family 4 protein n=1 Tax=Burkholderia sp. L27(2015) TaxID=1641858 RepID=UPI00131EA757|nr:glycosyltransferase family 1 protein [Burkholderia sp. L27(2015)]
MRTSPIQLTIGIELIDDPAWMGGTLYLRNLAICLSHLPESERPKVRLFGAPNVLSGFLSEWGHLPIFDSAADSWPGRVLRRLGLPIKPVVPVDVVYPGFGAQIPGAVTVRWIPDFQHRYLPHLFSADEIAARDRSIGDIAKQSGVVVFSSEVAADDFRRFYPAHHAVPRVWHFCSLLETTKPASPTTLQKYGLPEKFLYLPNQVWVHKNHITVLKALARLRHEQGMIIPLVCTGAQSDRRNEAHFASLLQFIEEQALRDQVHLLGLIDRGEQVDVLRHAAAVVQPSLFEGWSTVVEDVRATGRPVFLSDLPVHREQSPERCTYFNPESEQHLASVLAGQWLGLQPGPDYVAEKNAREALQNRILDSARIFCDIARNALGMSKV